MYFVVRTYCNDRSSAVYTADMCSCWATKTLESCAQSYLARRSSHHYRVLECVEQIRNTGFLKILFALSWDVDSPTWKINYFYSIICIAFWRISPSLQNNYWSNVDCLWMKIMIVAGTLNSSIKLFDTLLHGLWCTRTDEGTRNFGEAVAYGSCVSWRLGICKKLATGISAVVSHRYIGCSYAPVYRLQLRTGISAAVSHRYIGCS